MTISTFGKIDVHSHFLPSGYADEMIRAGVSMPDGMPGYPQWNPELALTTYDSFDIKTGILSISSPGVHYGDDLAAKRLARRVNEAGADLVRRFPSRFGLFASLPLPAIDASLEELAYALDVLGADGIELKTNAAGSYLGDPKFDPVFDELNRRKALVFVHPTSPSCSQCGLSHPRSVIEFPFDTTRAVMNMIFSGTLARCPHLRIIVPHSGGALPMLARRIASYGARPQISREGSVDVMGLLRTLYYDTANAGSDQTLASTLQLVDPSHMVYGSDWPWATASAVATNISDIEKASLLTERERSAIYRENALALFPRLRAIKVMPNQGVGLDSCGEPNPSDRERRDARQRS
jgi:predicted TIM-barrel fold metal-dependent hydrolase